MYFYVIDGIDYDNESLLEYLAAQAGKPALTHIRRNCSKHIVTSRNIRTHHSAAKDG